MSDTDTQQDPIKSNKQSNNHENSVRGSELPLHSNSSDSFQEGRQASDYQTQRDNSSTVPQVQNSLASTSESESQGAESAPLRKPARRAGTRTPRAASNGDSASAPKAEGRISSRTRKVATDEEPAPAPKSPRRPSTRTRKAVVGEELPVVPEAVADQELIAGQEPAPTPKPQRRSRLKKDIAPGAADSNTVERATSAVSRRASSTTLTEGNGASAPLQAPGATTSGETAPPTGETAPPTGVTSPDQDERSRRPAPSDTPIGSSSASLAHAANVTDRGAGAAMGRPEDAPGASHTVVHTAASASPVEAATAPNAAVVEPPPAGAGSTAYSAPDDSIYKGAAAANESTGPTVITTGPGNNSTATPGVVDRPGVADRPGSAGTTPAQGGTASPGAPRPGGNAGNGRPGSSRHRSNPRKGESGNDPRGRQENGGRTSGPSSRSTHGSAPGEASRGQKNKSRQGAPGREERPNPGQQSAAGRRINDSAHPSLNTGGRPGDSSTARQDRKGQGRSRDRAGGREGRREGGREGSRDRGRPSDDTRTNSSQGSIRRVEQLRTNRQQERPLPRGREMAPSRNRDLATVLPSQGEPVELGAEQIAQGVLEIRADGSGFLRTQNNWAADAGDVSVSAETIRSFNLKPGQGIVGAARPNGRTGSLIQVQTIDGLSLESARTLPRFTTLEAEIPFQRMRLETGAQALGPRLIDLLAPLGKGQRGLIVAPPQAGKTRLLRDIATSVATNHPNTSLFILLIDERPEEVTEFRSLGLGQVIASTFDESRVGHLASAELALERMQRLVEAGQDVFLLIDSLTRLARASNLSIRGTGRSLSGGLDPAALTFPRRLFGAARATKGAGNLTILATTLVETGSVMDEFVFQEFKGTGNWEVKLDRRLAQRRIFPAIDIAASSTRREELLYTQQELSAVVKLRQYLHKFSQQPESRSERLVWLLSRTRTNAELLSLVDRL